MDDEKVHSRASHGSLAATGRGTTDDYPTPDSSPVMQVTPKMLSREPTNTTMTRSFENDADDDESDLEEFGCNPRKTTKKESLIELLNSEPPDWIMRQQLKLSPPVPLTDPPSSSSPKKVRSFFSRSKLTSPVAQAFSRKQSLPASSLATLPSDEASSTLRSSKSVGSLVKQDNKRRGSFLNTAPQLDGSLAATATESRNASVSTFGRPAAHNFKAKDASTTSSVGTTKELAAFFRDENDRDSGTDINFVTSRDVSVASTTGHYHSRTSSLSSLSDSFLATTNNTTLSIRNVVNKAKRHIHRRASLVRAHTTDGSTEQQRTTRRQSLFTESVDDGQSLTFNGRQLEVDNESEELDSRKVLVYTTSPTRTVMAASASSTDEAMRHVKNGSEGSMSSRSSHGGLRQQPKRISRKPAPASVGTAGMLAVERERASTTQDRSSKATTGTVAEQCPHESDSSISIPFIDINTQSRLFQVLERIETKLDRLQARVDRELNAEARVCESCGLNLGPDYVVEALFTE
ncbi:hypothetical protein ACM66B_001042 [Microbotryomycetes sp. NB124-2]